MINPTVPPSTNKDAPTDLFTVLVGFAVHIIPPIQTNEALYGLMFTIEILIVHCTPLVAQ
jgi:hypothetical protein